MAEHADLIVLGAGSGGLSLALRAAELGARVVLFEPRELGGTCVNRGCVPKKAMWLAAQFAQSQQLAAAIGFDLQPAMLDWRRFHDLRERYVANIGKRYAERLQATDIQVVRMAARLLAADTVTTAHGEHYRAAQIVIATGARPRTLDIPGFALGMTSDDVFDLLAAPKRVGIVGGGYVAIEFACILHALGCEVELLIRDRMLQHFDASLVERLAGQMQARGIRIIDSVEIVAARGEPGAIRLDAADGSRHGAYDAVLWALGRVPNSDKLGLQSLGIHCDRRGRICTDAWQNTSVPGVAAIGDVTDRQALTPVAVAAARVLAERLFGGRADARFDDAAIPSVVFAQPPLGMVGLTEAQARERHGDAVRVHQGHFVPLSHRLAGEEQAASAIRLVCVGGEQRVVGIHVLGPGTDELLQGFAVALRQGLCWHELKAAVALHPTAAEELLLLA